VKEIHEAIRKSEGIPIEQQRLIWAGRNLEVRPFPFLLSPCTLVGVSHVSHVTQADRLVEEYGIPDGATLHLVLQLDRTPNPRLQASAAAAAKQGNTTQLKLAVESVKASGEEGENAMQQDHGATEDLSLAESEGLLRTLGAFASRRGNELFGGQGKEEDETDAAAAFAFKKEEEAMEEEDGEGGGRSRIPAFPSVGDDDERSMLLEEGQSEPERLRCSSLPSPDLRNAVHHHHHWTVRRQRSLTEETLLRYGLDHRVLRCSPEGELKTPSSQVIIVFSLPMIAVTSHQELQEMGSVEGVSISPFIDGSWKWY
jgi:hypothetical protein